MKNKFVKNSDSSVKKEMLIKTAMRYHLLMKLQKIKNR